MKRTAFIKEITSKGCELYRHGKKHDIYINQRTGAKSSIPRHQELKNTICKVIKKQLGLD